MKMQKLLAVLTIANALLLVFLLTRPHGVEATSTASVLRGRSLEIVDDQGRVRAEIKVLPAQPELKMPDGTKGYPETVLLRLLTSTNGPNVKLATTEDGSGLVLGGDPGYVQILGRGPEPLVKVVAKNGKEQTFKP